MAFPLRAAEALGFVLGVLESALVVPVLDVVAVLGLDACVATRGAVDVVGVPPVDDAVRELSDGAAMPDVLPVTGVVAAAARAGLRVVDVPRVGDPLVFFPGCGFAEALSESETGVEAVLVGVLVAATAAAFLVFVALSLVAEGCASGVLLSSALVVFLRGLYLSCPAQLQPLPPGPLTQFQSSLASMPDAAASIRSGTAKRTEYWWRIGTVAGCFRRAHPRWPSGVAGLPRKRSPGKKGIF